VNKEEIYDDQISPLMEQIINICKKNNIAMLMSFSIPTEDDPDLACTTAIVSDECDPPGSLLRAYETVMGRSPGMPNMMITTKNENGETVGMTAVI